MSQDTVSAAGLLAEAIRLIHGGELQPGIAMLQEARRLDPQDCQVAGHLAWVQMEQGNLDEAIGLYEFLRREQPENCEVPFRIAQARFRAAKNPTVKDFRRAFSGVEMKGLPPSVWRHFVEEVRNVGDQDLLHECVTAAHRACPEDPVLAGFRERVRRRRSRSRLLAIARAVGAERVVRWLARSGTVRTIFLNEAGAAVDSFQRALEEFYRQGSIFSTFPQAPEEQRPENFAAYFQDCKVAWWLWMKEYCRPVAGLKLLDVGCGPGFIGHHFAAYGYEVTGLSGSLEELAECRQRGFKTVRAEMHAIPLPDASFDYVLASHVLEHSIAPFVLLCEIKRLLKPGGRLLVNLPFPIDAEPRRDFPDTYDATTDTYRFDSTMQFTGKIPEISYYSYGFPPHVFVLTYWQWRWLFKQAGFRHIASGIDDYVAVRPPTEDLLKQLRDKPHHTNQLFVLEKVED